MSDSRRTELVFLNGLDHIGGVQIVLRTPTAELYFDLGLGQTEQAALFNSVVPAGASGHPLPDYLRSAMAPLAHGLYDEQLLPGGLDPVLAPLRRAGAYLADAPVFEQRRHRAAFVSHLHSDHSGLLPYLARHVPVHMSETSVTLQRALERAGCAAPTGARLIGQRHGSTARVGDIDITFLDVDHDTPGAMGFIASTPDGAIAYTGDWRYHGRNPQRMDEFAQRCAEVGVDVLLTEASTAVELGAPRWPWGAGIPTALVGHESRPSTEVEACESLEGAIASASALVLVCLHRQHLERAAELLRIAYETGRRLVLEGATARFWQEAAYAGLLPDVQGRVAVYETEAAAGLPVVADEEIASDRSAYLCQVSATTQAALLRVGAGQGDVLVHANGHPLGSQYPGWRTLEHWVADLGLDFVVIDSHGHAEPAALRRFARATRATRVIPLHSDHVTRADVPEDRRYLPSRWEALDLRHLPSRWEALDLRHRPPSQIDERTTAP